MSNPLFYDADSYSIEKIDHSEKRVARQIYSVFQRSYRVEADLLGVSSFPPLTNTVKDISLRKTDFYGYWKDSELAAVAELDVSGHFVDICSFVVDPAFFRQGIGSRFLDALLSHFPDRDKVVETGVDNHPAIALYQKQGFIEKSRWLTEIGIAKIRLSMKARIQA